MLTEEMIYLSGVRTQSAAAIASLSSNFCEEQGELSTDKEGDSPLRSGAVSTICTMAPSRHGGVVVPLTWHAEFELLRMSTSHLRHELVNLANSVGLLQRRCLLRQAPLRLTASCE